MVNMRILKHWSRLPGSRSTGTIRTFASSSQRTSSNSARSLARHIGDHIPGNPSVIVQNMPGAGSLTAVRYLDATARKDGTVMTIIQPRPRHPIARRAQEG
jgi:hypothetical protein